MPNEDFSAYLTPGVYVEEIDAPVVSSTGIAPTVLGLVGDSQRFRSNAEIVQLDTEDAVGPVPTTLAKLGVDASTIVVTNRFTGETYVETQDYTWSQTAGDSADTTRDDVTALTRVGTGNITPGTFVTVTYQYTDVGYFDPQSFQDYDDVRDLYGNPFDSQGNINSPMTLAAFFAFANGASEVVAAAVDPAGAQPTAAEFQTALDKLKDQLHVNVVVPVTTDATVATYVQAHVQTMYNQGLYRRAFIGGAGTYSNIANHGFSDPRVVVIGPSRYTFYDGTTDSLVELGAEYAAAAVAGSHASRPVQIPLTRKQIRGFYTIPDQITESQMVSVQRQGTLWLRQKRGGQIIVRHGLTTDTTNVYTREINIQASKDRLMTLIFEALENQELVGSVMTDTTPQDVVGSVSGILEFAKDTQLIQNYSGLKYRIPSNQPTEIQIRFMYKPSLPLNYVQVQFAIDTSTGASSFTDTAEPVFV